MTLEEAKLVVEKDEAKRRKRQTRRKLRREAAKAALAEG